MEEELLFLACHGRGVKIVDMSASPPEVIGQFNDGGEAYGVTVAGPYAFVADLQEGVKLLDVSDPKEPKKVAEYKEAHPHSIHYDGRYIYLADESMDLVVLEYDTTGQTFHLRSSRPGFSLAGFWPLLVPPLVLVTVLALVLVRAKRKALAHGAS